MIQNDITSFFKYSNLQIAAERPLVSGAIEKDDLTNGNLRASRMPVSIAEQFALDWVVVEQRNTNTGFSGTLFRCIQNAPERGLTAGELVMCFRSTEFADDSARDTEATNNLEISQSGWALGQIDDMRSWYEEMTQKGTIPTTAQLSVTGYSLGGHLATAFNELYPQATGGTYTFNGAGVGEVLGRSLTQLIDDFHDQRTNGHIGFFKQPDARDLYLELRMTLNDPSTLTDAKLRAANDSISARINNVLNTPNQNPIEALKELRLLETAFDRVKRIYDEAQRVQSGIESGVDPTIVPNATPVAPSDIGALALDYQLAALRSASFSEAGETYFSVFGRNQRATWEGMYDIYGAPPPSAVANSQWHFGQATPVYIEDQPLYRGNPLYWLPESLAYGFELKLLNDNFAFNDFGDTHSLALLVDSLAVQNLLAKLQPTLGLNDMSALLSAASFAEELALPGSQGTAEGDTLENMVDGLRRVFFGPQIVTTPFSLLGGTWSLLEYRNPLHANISSLTKEAAFTALVGNVVLSQAFDGDRAGQDFLALLSLSRGATLMLTTQDQSAMAALGSLAANQAAYSQWQTDVDRLQRDSSIQDLYFSPVWAADRASYLNALTVRNIENLTDFSQYTDDRLTSAFRFDDRGNGITFLLTPTRSVPENWIGFGSVRPDVFSGGFGNDHFFGLEGADNLTGQAGNDWLEGGGGADALGGDAGQDTLLGGDGGDALDGGEGNDALYGGKGGDTYTFSASWGRDIVDDQDGIGTLITAGTGVIDGSGTVRWAENIWRSADGQITFVLDSASSTLTIGFKDHSDTLLLRNWSTSRNLGINLPSTAPPPKTLLLFSGDFEKKVASSGAYERDGLNYVAAGAAVGSQDVITGSAGADKLVGGGGNDGLAAMAGDDSLAGGAGDDLLLGGSGADTLSGGTGNDYLYAAGIGGLNYLSRPDSNPPAAYGPEISRGFAWVVYDAGIDGNGVPIYTLNGGNAFQQTGDQSNLLDGGAGNDNAVGGDGNDVVLGGDGQDSLKGAGGADVLFGGNGNDWVAGDGIALSGYYSSTPGAQHGRDTLIGGQGNDSIEGQGNDDVLFGDEGDDLLYGDAYGETQAPTLNHGNDYLDGGEGNDELVGWGRNDTLIGGLGNDTLMGDDWSATLALLPPQGSMEEGAGDAQTLRMGHSTEWLREVLDLLRTTGAYPAMTEPQTSSVGGADQLEGGSGDDLLLGGGGGDTLTGGDGADQMLGDGPLAAGELGGSDQLDGGDGDDWLAGEAGDDQLRGGAGSDQLAGGAGNDTLDGGMGADAIEGMEGDDVYIFDSGDSPSLPILAMASPLGAAEGHVFLTAWSSVTPQGSYHTTAVYESLNDNLGHNTVTFNGVSSANISAQADSAGQLLLNYSEQDNLVIVNFAGAVENRYLFDDGESFTADRIAGQFSVNTIKGTDALGHTRIYGGMRNDSISGGAEYMTVSGGLGDDILQMSGGNTTYLYSLGDGTDIIRDSSPGLGADGLTVVNRISFGENITASDLKITGSASDTGGALLIQVGESWDDRIELNRTPRLPVAPNWEFSFADGTSLTLAQLLSHGFKGSVNPDVVNASVNDDDIHGQNGNDSLSGGAGHDWIDGGSAQDELQGDSGDDTMIGGGGNDSLWGGLGADVYQFGKNCGNDEVFNDDTDSAGSQLDTLSMTSGIRPSDLILRRVGDDLWLGFQDASDSLTVRGHFALGANGSAIDQIQFDDGSVWNRNTIEQHALAGTASADSLMGTAAQDSLLGGGSADTLTGGDGNDTLRGENGQDSLDGGAGDDRLYGGSGWNQLNGGAGQDSLIGGSASEDLRGDEGQDTLVGGGGNDYLAGGNGSDTYRVQTLGSLDTISNLDSDLPGQEADTLELGADMTPGNITLTRHGSKPSLESGVYDLYLGKAGSGDFACIKDYFLDDGNTSNTVEFIKFPDGTLWTYATVNALVQTIAPDLRINGAWGQNDRLTGGAGNDTLDGNYGGYDTLDGGAGADRLQGGDVVTIQFGLGSGKDLAAIAQGEVQMKAGVRPEDVSLSLAGNQLIVTLPGGADTLTIENFFKADHQGVNGQTLTRIVFATSEVWDSAEIERRLGITAKATGDDDWLIGQANASNTINGLSGDDNLHGRSQNDVLNGGEGDDFIAADGGNDRLDGGTGQDTLYGNDGNDLLVGGSGDDRLQGGNGEDTMDGGAGNDLIDLSGNCTVLFGRGGGFDRLWQQALSVKIELAADLQPDDIILTPSGLTIVDTGDRLEFSRVDRIVFADGTEWTDDQIQLQRMSGTDDGDDFTNEVNFAGDDRINGGRGHDSIHASYGRDTIDGGEGNDSLNGGSASDDILGGAHDDALLGDAQSDTLSGGSGNDTILGGQGNDLYLYMLGDGTDIIDFERYVDQTAYTDVLRLGEGIEASTLMLERGWMRFNGSFWYTDPTYLRIHGFGDSGEILISEFFGEYQAAFCQFDALEFYGGERWASWQIVELLSASIMNGSLGEDSLLGDNNANRMYGAEGADTLNGADGHDWIDGGAGPDQLLGGAGNDTFVVDDEGDLVIETADNGIDTVQSKIDLVIPAEVEYLRLIGQNNLQAIGDSRNNSLLGNDGNNLLNGGAGADSMAGGRGNDHYYVDSALDQLTEVDEESFGYDSVFAEINWTLNAGFESLTLIGNAIAGTGNTLNNLLQGNEKNNTLNGEWGSDTLVGGGGADTMRGGSGDDTYEVDHTGDVVEEAVDFYTNDTVKSSVNYVLPDNVDSLILVGSLAISGSGNSLDNQLIGNSKANRIEGYAGNDSLTGGAGKDTLAGGSGDDTYFISAGDGRDVIEEAGEARPSRDRIVFQNGVHQADVTFRRVGQSLEVVIGDMSQDALQIAGWFDTAGPSIEEFQFADGSLLASDITNRLLNQVSGHDSDTPSVTEPIGGLLSLWSGGGLWQQWETLMSSPFIRNSRVGTLNPDGVASDLLDTWRLQLADGPGATDNSLDGSLAALAQAMSATGIGNQSGLSGDTFQSWRAPMSDPLLSPALPN